MKETKQVFVNGNEWVRADFHLHTKEDYEFKYDGEPNSFINEYVEKLKQEGIKVAAITNHNKFKLEEYKGIAKKAKKVGICVLPGVELSVDDGSNGIHTLIIFNSDDWIVNDTDFINQFLTAQFTGKTNFENENGRSNNNLIETIRALDAFQKDYFIIMAHIEQKSGFYEALDGGRVKEFADNPLFRKRVLAFQKVRTRDYVDKLNLWFNSRLPAFVEGSDAKSIEEIGTGNAINGVTQKSFIKIGAYNFEAIKFALIDKMHRCSKEIKKPTNGYLKSISFKGGKLNGETIQLNHSLNNLIGIRGSGKSSILETIRYALDINISEPPNVDVDYKEKLVNFLVGSGGKISCTLIDNEGNEFISEKILGEQTTIYRNSEPEFGLKPNAIIKKPIYFGQKDLSQIGNSLSTEYLINKLIGERLNSIKIKIEDKIQDVIKIISDISKVNSKLKRKQEFEEKLASLKLKIQTFKDHKIDQKLEKQISFDKDQNFIDRILDFELEIINSIDEFVNNYLPNFDSFVSYNSKENKTTIDQVMIYFEKFKSKFEEIQKIKEALNLNRNSLQALNKSFKQKYDMLKEEFSTIKRAINLPNIQADDYVRFTKEHDLKKTQLSEIQKQADQKIKYKQTLKLALNDLKDLWHEEFGIVQEEVAKVNKEQDAIQINVHFKGDNDSFKSYLKENLKGSSLNDSKLSLIVEAYADLIDIYNDMSKSENKISTLLTENQFYNFKKYVVENISAFLTYRVPDRFEIIYRERPLNEHSLGQRASALIIFLLTLKDSDLIIIDQPEDDLDNQTIYNDVIKVLKKLKGSTQFIFATHNPNLPVLGDSDQTVTCNYHNNKIEINSGSVDNDKIREDIVNIMEGGKEAFKNRKQIYELWTH